MADFYVTSTPCTNEAFSKLDGFQPRYAALAASHAAPPTRCALLREVENPAYIFCPARLSRRRLRNMPPMASMSAEVGSGVGAATVTVPSM